MADLAALVAHVLALQPKGKRVLVAISGPPASGKSTLAANLVDHLGANAALVPMDGFHLDNSVLTARGILQRKGAPETFDALGFAHMVHRLAREDEVVIPTFVRARDIAIAGANVIGPDIDIAVVEGNYLLLDAAPWRALRNLWDCAISLEVPIETLRARLIQRWLDHGLDPDIAIQRAEANDLPNAERMLTGSFPADIILTD